MIKFFTKRTIAQDNKKFLPKNTTDFFNYNSKFLANKFLILLALCIIGGAISAKK